jgi:hypothetical protein
VIAAHWDFYNGETPDPRALPIDAADAALLHARLAGTAALERRPGWVVVYRDPLAVLLVREAERFPGLRGKALPIEAGPEAVRGRVPFACCQSAALSPVRSASAGGSALQAHTFTGRRAVAFSCP